MDWDAISAVATALAVFVALGLAQQADRQKLKADRQKAGLVAARLLESVRFLDDKVRGMMASFTFYEESSDWRNENFAEEAVALRRLGDAIDIETLQALEPLPGNCANRLAMALGVIDSLGREVEYVKAGRPWSELGPTARKHYAKHWVVVCSRAADYLRVVEAELEKAAGVAAPAPSSEELYGDTDPET